MLQCSAVQWLQISGFSGFSHFLKLLLLPRCWRSMAPSFSETQVSEGTSGERFSCAESSRRSVPNFFLFFCLSVQLCCAVLWPSAVINFTPYATVSPSFSYSLVPNVILIWFSLSPSFSRFVRYFQWALAAFYVVFPWGVFSSLSLLCSSNGAWPASFSSSSVNWCQQSCCCCCCCCNCCCPILTASVSVVPFFFYASFKLLFSYLRGVDWSWKTATSRNLQKDKSARIALYFLLVK